MNDYENMYSLMKEKGFVYEHKFHFETFDFASLIADDNCTSVDILSDDDFESIMFPLVQSKKIAITWGEYSYNEFSNLVCRGYLHLDLMQCYMKLYEKDDFISLSSVFYSAFEADESLKTFGHFAEIYSNFDENMKILQNRAIAIDFLFYFLLNRHEFNFKDVFTADILAEFEKYKIEKEIELEILEIRERKRI